MRDVAWREVLRPYYDELGIDAGVPATGSPREPFNTTAADVLAEWPPVVNFHFGLPSADLLARVRGRGAKVLSPGRTRALVEKFRQRF